MKHIRGEKAETNCITLVTIWRHFYKLSN